MPARLRRLCLYRDGRKRKPPANPRRFYALSDFKFHPALFQPFLSFTRTFFNLFTAERQKPFATLDARAARQLCHAPAALTFKQTLDRRDVREAYASQVTASARDPQAQRPTPERFGCRAQSLDSKRPGPRRMRRIV
jgi:hypothetical protein